MKPIIGFKINQGYTRMTVWEFGRQIQSVICTTTITPRKELSRRQKYNELMRVLRSAKLTCPSYKS